MQAAPDHPADAPHIPVLLPPLLRAVAPITGRWLDGTFGNGGYTRGLLAAGADHVVAVDRDPVVFEMAASWLGDFGGSIETVQGVFSRLDEYAQNLDGIVLDLGVSSMQIDQAERGFSFMKDGPLDMRMSQSGTSAADLVNTASEEMLADILFHFGEERASRRIARAIVHDRVTTPFTTTLQLAGLIERLMPRQKPGQSHPATRSFQALRIAVNNEYDELAKGLVAAEKALKSGGRLAVVTFHSIEDRIVKRFLQSRGGAAARTNRYAPEAATAAAPWQILTKKALGPDAQELEENPRSRSAKLRVAQRTGVAASPHIDRSALGIPMVKGIE